MVQDVIEEHEFEQANGQANGHANGRLNGKPAGSAHDELLEEEEQTNENIFLFIPNLIGKHGVVLCRPWASTLTRAVLQVISASS